MFARANTNSSAQRMATTASIATNSASPIHSYSMSRSRRDSSPWTANDSDAIHDDPTLTVSQDDRLFSPGKDTSDNDNADKKSVWNKASSISVEVAPVMGAESWPALSLSARGSSNKSPSLESDGSATLPTSQIGVTPLNSNSNVNAGSISAAENHTVNGQRRPYRRNNMTSSSSTRDQNHSQRGGGSYGSGPTSQFRDTSRNRNSNSYPRGDHGNMRNYEHGNQSGFTRRGNYSGKDMHLQPQRGIGMMRPHMLMGPPSFPASSAQYMAAPQIGSYGGPMIYQDYAPQIFMPHPPPDSMPLVGHFPPLAMYYPSFDAMFYNKILTQVEFYFSADNLSRDEHLRHQMNGEGWVPIRVIAGFRRLAELTNNTQTIIEALRTSQVVEIKGETIRRRGDWEKYLWPSESPKFSPAATASSNASLQSQLESMTL